MVFPCFQWIIGLLAGDCVRPRPWGKNCRNKSPKSELMHKTSVSRLMLELFIILIYACVKGTRQTHKAQLGSEIDENFGLCNFKQVVFL